eukprot:TRINITY_DN5308_c0_g1_i1.p1 TRINITY_DN5308_c0_g1~~TRINITY_DN5308_c0_g1_i1.p1  ORF type:complete len:193 (-),score=9.51 TRINITY_DN5308_c0_g1_i1:44-622(-)
MLDPVKIIRYKKIYTISFGLMLVTIMMGLMVFFTFFYSYTYKELHAKATFIKANCTIHTSNIDKQQKCSLNNCNFVYACVMSVEYYNDQIHEEINATAFNTFDGSYGYQDTAEKFQETHPVGSTFECSYDRNRAQKVVFNFSHSTMAILGEIVGIIIICIGIAFLISGVCFFKLHKRLNHSFNNNHLLHDEI